MEPLLHEASAKADVQFGELLSACSHANVGGLLDSCGENACIEEFDREVVVAPALSDNNCELTANRADNNWTVLPSIVEELRALKIEISLLYRKKY